MERRRGRRVEERGGVVVMWLRRKTRGFWIKEFGERRGVNGCIAPPLHHTDPLSFFLKAHMAKSFCWRAFASLPEGKKMTCVAHCFSKMVILKFFSFRILPKFWFGFIFETWKVVDLNRLGEKDVHLDIGVSSLMISSLFTLGRQEITSLYEQVDETYSPGNGIIFLYSRWLWWLCVNDPHKSKLNHLNILFFNYYIYYYYFLFLMEPFLTNVLVTH